MENKKKCEGARFADIPSNISPSWAFLDYGRTIPGYYGAYTEPVYPERVVLLDSKTYLVKSAAERYVNI